MKRECLHDDRTTRRTRPTTAAALSLLLLLPGWAFGAEKYGGIEIGAKGVKVSAVSIEAGDNPTVQVLELPKATFDLTISRLREKDFASEKVADVAAVVDGFYEQLQKELGVPADHIQVVASSGVPFTRNYDELVDAVKQATGKELEKIDAAEEAKLTAIALVPPQLRDQTLVIDIGSGNTKGGAFAGGPGSDEFTSFDVKRGAVTLAAAIAARAEESKSSPASVAAAVAKEQVGEPLAAVLAEKPVLGRRGLVLMGGGTVWAFQTLMHPETALQPFPVIRPADIRTYADRLAQAGEGYPQADMAAVTDAAARAAAEADYGRVTGGGKPGARAAFKPEELAAGAAILTQLSETFNFASKTVVFDRKAVTAWITAKITPAEYRGLLPGALKRELKYTPPVAAAAEAAATAPARRVDEAAALQAYGRGWDLYWSGRPAEALAEFDRAIGASAGDARFWYYKGLAQFALGDNASGDASFAEGARCERRGSPNSRTVGLSLIRVQGPPRRYIEQIKKRVEASEAPSRPTSY